jgi:DNA-binding transcriptional LysR family regulator
VRGLVAAGIGIALVPRLASPEDDPAIAVLPSDLPPRVITMAWHVDRYRSPASRSFVAIAREVCLELAETASTAND